MVYKRIIPEHEGLRQEDPEFKANLGYREGKSQSRVKREPIL